MYIFCIYSSVEVYLVFFFQFLAITNKAPMNIVEHVALFHVGASSWYMLRSGIAWSSGRTMYSFQRKCHTDFQSGCTSLQSHQQWRSVLLSPHPRQHLLSPVVLILAILTGVRWNLRIILICISLITKDFEHFFKCFSAHCILFIFESQRLLTAHMYVYHMCVTCPVRPREDFICL